MNWIQDGCMGGFKLLLWRSAHVRCHPYRRNVMTIKPAKRFLPIACCVMLAACGGVPASNQLQFDSDGTGRFSGSAGSDWTPQEIETEISDLECGDGAILDFEVRRLPSSPDYMIFSGRCAAGALTAANNVQNQRVSRPAGAAGAVPVQNMPAPNVTSGPVPVTMAGNSAGWDGSTPFVD